MKLSSKFKEKTVFSFEVFPPKKTSPIEAINGNLGEIASLCPDYISVTYSAGGSGNTSATSEIASLIKEKHGIEPVAHLTCLRYSKDEIKSTLDDLSSHGVENILALRGDKNPDFPPKDDFRYASELVTFIKSYGDFDVAGACYPEGHIEAPDVATDILNLRKKVDAGTDFLISQLFFDNSYFYAFRERMKIAGISVPVEAGIMPVTNKNQIERMVTTCGASLPQKFVKAISRYENNPEALRDAGIAYAIDQIVDLLSQGVEGIHLYTMNNPYIARKITESVKNLINA